MKRLLMIAASGLAVVASLLSSAVPASAADAGTFTLSNFTSANLTVNNLTITRDASGAYTAAINYTVGGKQLTVPRFSDQGCAPNGVDCHVVNGSMVRYRDNFLRAYFWADLSGMDTANPTVTITQAWTGGDHWPNDFAGASAPMTAVLEQHLTCKASLSGSTSADLSWTDPGSGATSYDIAASPALPAPVSVSSGPTTATIKGLNFGTDYTFTVTGVGGKAKAATCSVRTEAKPAAPVGKVAYGAITGAKGSAVQEVLLSTDAPAPTGWTLAWTSRLPGDIALPFTVACGTDRYLTPELRKAGESPIRGAELTVHPPCAVDVPAFVSGSISGSTVTVNYSLTGPAAPGVTIMAAYKLSGVPGPDIYTPLGAPPAGGSAGTGSFNAPGLMPPMSAYVRLFAVNGPVESSLTGQNRVFGELPVLNDYTTTITGVAGESAPKTTASPVPGNFTPQSATRASHLYKLAPGSTLPAGLKVDQLTGVVKSNGGTLAAGTGSAMIVLQSFDGQRSSNAARVNYAIAPAPPAPGKVTYPDVQAVVGGAVSVQPVKGSGTSGYFFSKNLCTQFPGLSLDNATGRITGTPTAPSTLASVDVTIAKSAGTACGDPVGAFVARTQVRIQIDLAPQQFAIVYPQSSITALIGSPIAAGAPNVLPAGTHVDTFTVTGGVLPTGVVLDKATGAISGTATSTASGSKVTITATDTQANRTASADVTFTILPAPSGANAALAYPSIAAAPIGVPLAVVPTGTVTGQTFALDAASLAAGMSIDAKTGKITWTPKAPQGARTVTVTVSAGGTTAPLAPFTITVTPAPATTTGSGSAGAASTAGASTGGAGGSSGASGARSGTNACLAPNGSLYSDLSGSVGSTLTMAPNTLGLPPAKSFTVTKGSLPPGVRLDGTFGVISGTPERVTSGNGALEITATWPDGTVRVSDFSIVVDDPHHAVNYPNQIIGSIGQPLTVSPLPINAVGATRYQLVCGSVPAGMTFNSATGVISGTPTALDERPVPLRIRMTDTYGWVDASLLVVVNSGVTPWLAYPEYMEIGVGQRVAIVPTTTGLPTVARYFVSQGLPKGLTFNTKTGAITGSSVVNDGIIYEPTILALDAEGKQLTSTWVSITVIKPAVAMQVIARPETSALKPGVVALVAKVRHPNYSSLSAKVTCKSCTSTFTPSTGKLVVKVAKGATSVTVRILASPIGAKAKTAFAGHTWSRTWRVTR